MNLMIGIQLQAYLLFSILSLIFRFWPDIDNAIRAALFRGVSVQLMVSNWPHTKRQIIAYLKSLLELNSAVSGQISIVRFIFYKRELILCNS